MTKGIMEWWNSPIGFKKQSDFKIAEFPKQFPKKAIRSDIKMKTTGRSLDQVSLREYLPIESVLTQEQGIDEK